MRKYLLPLLLLVVLALTGCASKSNVVDIKEKLFIAQVDDIYLNHAKYMDKTIKLEGMFFEYIDPDTDKKHDYVIRYSPGCCGDDGMVGFKILYTGDLPNPNDWVEAVGKLEFVKGDADQYLALRLSKLTVLKVRGAEFVIN